MKMGEDTQAVEKMTAADFKAATGLDDDAFQQLAEKAVLSTTANTSYGTLNARQRDRFVRLIRDLSVMTGDAQILDVPEGQLDIPTINMTAKPIMGNSEGTAISDANESGVTFGGLSLSPKIFQLYCRVGTQILQYRNIEGENIYNTIDTLLAREFSNSLEVGAIQGVSGSSNPYTNGIGNCEWDGWWKTARDNANVYDAGGNKIKGDTFFQVRDQIPEKWRQAYPRRDQWTFYCASAVIDQFERYLSNRNSNTQSDAWLTQGEDGPQAYGIDLKRVPHIPTDVDGILGDTTTGSYTYIFLVPDGELLMAAGPNVKWFRHPHQQGIYQYITLSGWFDFGFEVPNRVAIGVNITPTADVTVT